MKKRALISDISGQDGSYLAELTMELITESRADFSTGLFRPELLNFAGALEINPRRALTLRAFKWLVLSPWESAKVAALPERQ